MLPPASSSFTSRFSLLNSFDPTSADPEFPNDSAESPKEEKQTQGREEHGEQENENRLQAVPFIGLEPGPHRST